jgi:hypothetical protein
VAVEGVVILRGHVNKVVLGKGRARASRNCRLCSTSTSSASTSACTCPWCVCSPAANTALLLLRL